MGRPDSCEPAGLGFDQGAKVITAPGALLLEVGADLGEHVVRDGGIQQLPVGGNAGFR